MENVKKEQKIILIIGTLGIETIEVMIEKLVLLSGIEVTGGGRTRIQFQGKKKKLK